ncbi:MAG: type IV pilin protein [Pseudomonadota bacterium]
MNSLAMKQRGMTLIELLLVIVILGIIVSIALPGYQDSVRKARRADSQAVMLELAQWMERFYTENGRYDQDRAGAAVAPPPILLASPREGTTIFYNMVVATPDDQSFTITATPNGGQVGDKCGNLTLNQASTRGVSTSVPVSECW